VPCFQVVGVDWRSCFAVKVRRLFGTDPIDNSANIGVRGWRDWLFKGSSSFKRVSLQLLPSPISAIIVPMCGRYRLSRRKQVIEEHFDAVSDTEDWEPRFNIAPTQGVLVIRQNPTEPTRELSQMRWGLIPSWSKDPWGATRMINARSETAHTLPAFREAMKYQDVSYLQMGATSGSEWERPNSRTALKGTRGNSSRSRPISERRIG